MTTAIIIASVTILILGLTWMYYRFRTPPCQHVWDEKLKAGTNKVRSIYETEWRQVGNWYDRRCSKCGEIRRFET
jgi:hypothetical protein